ncbi:unnamed protein product, partial [Tilletia caries]
MDPTLILNLRIPLALAHRLGSIENAALEERNLLSLIRVYRHSWIAWTTSFHCVRFDYAQHEKLVDDESSSLDEQKAYLDDCERRMSELIL